jgi:hypothetical protein
MSNPKTQTKDFKKFLGLTDYLDKADKKAFIKI